MDSDPIPNRLIESSACGGRESRRLFLWVLAFVFIGSLLLYWSLRFPNAPLNADSFVYLSGAKSLSEGNGYRMEWHAGRPPIGLYPPGNSWWLSLFWPKGAGFDVALPRLSFAMAIIGAMANAMILTFLSRGGLPLRLAVPITMVWCVSPLWVQWLHFFLSDPAFLLFVMAGMALFVGRNGRPTPARWGTLGVLLAISLVWRSAALGMIAGVGFVLLLSKASVRTWFVAMGPSVAALATRSKWSGSGGAGYLENYTTFLQDFGGIRGLLALKFEEILSWFSGRFFFEAVFPLVSRTSAFLEREQPALAWIAGFVMWICFLVLLFLAKVGWSSIGRGRTGIAAVLTVYSLVVFAAPNAGWFVHRYLYPVWILILLSATRGLLIRFPRIQAPGSWQGRSLLAFLLVLVSVNAWGSIRVRKTWDQPSWVSDLKVVADRLLADPVRAPLVAVDINSIPALSLGDRMGSCLVDAYMVPRKGLFLPIFVRHSDQGFVRADYLLTAAGEEANSASGFLEEIQLTTIHRLRLFRVIPDEEAAWRRRAMVPEADPASRR